MEKEYITKIVVAEIENIMNINGVDLSSSLMEIGANSIDRVDIVSNIERKIGERLSFGKLLQAASVNDIIDIVFSECN